VYFSDITVKNICQSFAHKMAAKASWHRNYVTVILCIIPAAAEANYKSMTTVMELANFDTHVIETA